MNYIGEVKICSRCKLSKSYKEYNKRKLNKDGLASYCKECQKRYKNTLNYSVSVTEKKCSKCLNIKSHREFRRDRTDKSGLKSWCHRCELDAQYAYNKTNAGRAKIRRNSYSSTRYSHSKTKAKHKGIEWTLTKDEFNRLRQQPCIYCDRSIVTTGSGLDRKDPLIGYTLSNVVPCCYLCNTMKWNYWTYEEMCRIGGLVKILIAERLSRF